MNLFLTDQADYEAGIKNVRARQRADEFASAWVEGQALTLNEAVAYALGQLS